MLKEDKGLSAMKNPKANGHLMKRGMDGLSKKKKDMSGIFIKEEKE
jgi:hypothetical protein